MLFCRHDTIIRQTSCRNAEGHQELINDYASRQVGRVSTIRYTRRAEDLMGYGQSPSENMVHLHNGLLSRFQRMRQKRLQRQNELHAQTSIRSTIVHSFQERTFTITPDNPHWECASTIDTAVSCQADGSGRNRDIRNCLLTLRHNGHTDVTPAQSLASHQPVR